MDSIKAPLQDGDRILGISNPSFVMDHFGSLKKSINTILV